MLLFFLSDQPYRNSSFLMLHHSLFQLLSLVDLSQYFHCLITQGSLKDPFKGDYTSWFMGISTCDWYIYINKFCWEFRFFFFKLILSIKSLLAWKKARHCHPCDCSSGRRKNHFNLRVLTLSMSADSVRENLSQGII